MIFQDSNSYELNYMYNCIQLNLKLQKYYSLNVALYIPILPLIYGPACDVFKWNLTMQLCIKKFKKWHKSNFVIFLFCVFKNVLEFIDHGLLMHVKKKKKIGPTAVVYSLYLFS